MVPLIILTFWLVSLTASQVYNPSFRQTRLNPFPNGPRFGLFGLPPLSQPAVAPRGLPVRRRHGPTTVMPSALGEAAALKAGPTGSFDLTPQEHSILTNKLPVTQIKSHRDNINTEYGISVQDQTSALTEKVSLGATAILHCSFDTSTQIGAYKEAKIWWTKLPQRQADRPVILASGTQIRIPDERLTAVTFPDNSFSVLIIRNTIEEDAGDYKCSLPTITGTKTAFTLLQVKPDDQKIAVSAKETTIQVGEQLNLFCKPADSRLNVWWSAKDEDGNNIYIGQGFDKIQGSTLTINKIARSNAGVYTCHVESQVGPASRRHFIIKVKERPSAIVSYKDGALLDARYSSAAHSVEYSGSATLRCDSGGVPTPTFKWYYGQILLTTGNKYLISEYTPNYKEHTVTAKLTINNFQSTDSGLYRCVAENEAGATEARFILQGQGYRSSSRFPSDDEDLARQALRGRKGQLVLREGSGGGPLKG